jgi:hypothetical protein
VRRLMRALSTVCAVVLSSAAICAQTKEGRPPQTQTATVVIGTTELSLGMPRDAVLARLTDFKLINLHDDASAGIESYMVATSDSPANVIGEVQFRDKKLQSVSRHWESESKSETIPFLKSFYAAIEALRREEDIKGLGFVTCLIHPGSTQAPDVEVQDIDFYCGPKLLSVQIITANGKKFGNDVHIVETLKADR